MGLAFWRSKKRAANAGDKPASRPPLPQDDDVDSRLDPAAGLRARARHRLIGASALLLAVAVIVPMVLDPDPKPVTENIPIDIPSERTPFAPRLSLPPVPAADAAGTPPPDQAPALGPAKGEPRADTRAEAKAEAPAEAKAPAKIEAKADDGKATKVEESRKAAEEASAPAAPASRAGKFVVQAAAPASEKAARELMDRLKKGGFAAYTEKVETKDGVRFRVRLGPYSTRDDAEKARARLKSQGINGNLVAL
ncbi:MAG TPA: SPOR domain-containing protein [Burkholderiaceae bacterium]|nr:SPOR domain-containing protein [Burkholderiaceae bacterium]